MKRVFLLLLILLLSTCRVPNENNVSNENTETAVWKTDSQGFVQFSTNASQHLGTSFLSVYETFQDPLGTVSAEVKKISGSLMGGFGLVFCYQDVDNFYLLCIDVQGFYQRQLRDCRCRASRPGPGRRRRRVPVPGPVMPGVAGFRIAGPAGFSAAWRR